MKEQPTACPACHSQHPQTRVRGRIRDPRQVMNVAVLAESELGSEAQRERRKRILDATLAIASKGGYEAVQMRAVAERADVAVGTLYRYFPSKVHLLVSALGREFERIDAKTDRAALSGGTPYQRLNIMVGKLNRAMQRNPLLTEAMTRAFVFADASAAGEVDHVGKLMDSMFARAMSDGEPTEDQYHIARVISDVWLSNLLAWLTRRASATDVSKRLDLAVRLLIGDGEHPEDLGVLPADLQRALDSIARTPRLLVTCDFDGTLAPIVSDPADARMLPDAAAALTALADLPDTAVALVSGRALGVLRTLSAMPPSVHLVGSHGAEFDTGFAHDVDEGLLARIIAELNEIAADRPGVTVETKPASAALHVRNASPDDGEAALEEARSRLDRVGCTRHRGQGGTRVRGRLDGQG